MIVILEDDPRRSRKLAKTLRDSHLEHVIIDYAPQFIRWYRSATCAVSIISLDHDLEVHTPAEAPERFDPGTGRDVADFLAASRPIRPIIIHSANEAAYLGMDMVLRDSGWSTHRVSPYGDLQWIQQRWQPTLRRILKIGDGDGLPETTPRQPLP